jgi:uncharacterized protein
MRRFAFAAVDWDDGNRVKCTKHGVSLAEIEQVLRRAPTLFPDLSHSVTEERWQIIGRTEEGRYVFIVVTWRERDGERLIRPIGARYMHAKEIANYERPA